MSSEKRKRSPRGKRACEASGRMAPSFARHAAGATVRQQCPVCGQQVRLERIPEAAKDERQSTLRWPKPTKLRFVKHTRPLSDEEYAERKAKVEVVALRPRTRPSALA